MNEKGNRTLLLIVSLIFNKLRIGIWRRPWGRHVSLLKCLVSFFIHLVQLLPCTCKKDCSDVWVPFEFWIYVQKNQKCSETWLIKGSLLVIEHMGPGKGLVAVHFCLSEGHLQGLKRLKQVNNPYCKVPWLCPTVTQWLILWLDTPVAKYNFGYAGPPEAASLLGETRETHNFSSLSLFISLRCTALVCINSSATCTIEHILPGKWHTAVHSLSLSLCGACWGEAKMKGIPTSWGR